jgi:hypothetical protein
VRAFAFLLEIAASGLLGLRPVGVRFGRLGHAVEVRVDRVLADEHLPVQGDENGDGVAAGSLAQEHAALALHRHLVGDVVDAELRQALAHPPRGGAPLRLPELVHGSPLYN